MKRLPLLLCAVVLSPAAAARADIYLNLGGIYALRTNQPHASRPGAGISAGWAWNSRSALELGLGYWSSPVNGSTDGLSSGNISVLPLEVAFRSRWPLGSNLLLCAEAGAGWAFYSFSLDKNVQAGWEALGFTIDESVKNRPAAHLGVGLEYALSPGLAFDVGIRWRLLRTGGEWSITDDETGIFQSGTVEKLSFDALTLSLGVKISIFGSAEDGAQRE